MVQDTNEMSNVLNSMIDRVEELSSSYIIESTKRPTQSDFDSVWVADGKTLPIKPGTTFIWKLSGDIQQVFSAHQDYLLTKTIWSSPQQFRFLGFYDSEHALFTHTSVSGIVEILKIRFGEKAQKNFHPIPISLEVNPISYSKFRQAFISWNTGTGEICLRDETTNVSQTIPGIVREDGILTFYQESEILRHGTNKYFDLVTMSPTTLSALEAKRSQVSAAFANNLVARQFALYRSKTNTKESSPIDKIYDPYGKICLDPSTGCLLFSSGCSGYVYPLHIDNPPVTDLHVVGPTMISQSTFASISNNSVLITSYPPSTHKVTEYHINLVTSAAATLEFYLPFSSLPNAAFTPISASWQRQTNGNPATRVSGFANTGPLVIPLNTVSGTRFNILIRIHSTAIEIIVVHLSGAARTSEHLNINLRGNIDGQLVALSTANNFEGLALTKEVSKFGVFASQALITTSCFITGLFHRTETGSVDYLD